MVCTLLLCKTIDDKILKTGKPSKNLAEIFNKFLTNNPKHTKAKCAASQAIHVYDYFSIISLTQMALSRLPYTFRWLPGAFYF